ncbi:MAG: S8 family serine peptidase [Aestuariivirga sp.]
MTAPTDPLYAQQWYFDSLGNGRGRALLERVWNEFSGAGVHVIFYDSGIQRSHHDLDGNYDASRELVINGVPVPVEPSGTTPTDAHGTAVAGILAAENNGTGTVGISWGASITSAVIVPLNVTTVTTDRLHGAATFDISNNSWRNGGEFDPAFGAATPGSYYSAINDENLFACNTGRGGLGTIIVWGAANDHEDANGLGYNTSRHTITVAAIRDDGFSASYSNRGACILVSAPSGDTGPAPEILTTDLLGVAGANLFATQAVASDYTDWASGTSSATPIVSAVAALMLDANPGLGWRDVQNILSLTAFHTGSAFGSGPGLNEDHTWFFNEADNWNGGGQHFSEDYGYGNVDPYGAVRMAEAFAVMGAAAQTTANEHFFFNTFTPGSPALIDNGTYFFDFNVSTFPLTVEHADITFEITHPNYASLRLFLISPEGTEVQLYDGVGEAAINASTGFEWIYGVDAYRGERSTGTWRLKIVDTAPGGAGTLDSVRIDLFGSAPDSAADTYHFTDEFAQMRALDVTRGALADLDGGIDWINAAAVSTNVTINLNSGMAGRIDGAAFLIATGTTIENIIAGDGGDRLTGNSVANVLHGMRGNDILVGGNGNDTLNGGTGVDSMTGGAGDDSYYLDSYYDSTVEASGGGADKVFASITHALRINIENLELTGSANLKGTGNTLANSITGNAGSNTLNGLTGADSMTGLGGNDTYYVDNAGDSVTEALNQGIDIIRAALNWTLAANIEKLYITGTAANATGNTLSNFIYGNNGVNIIDGGMGADRMYGYNGNDKYIVDSSGDLVYETSAAGGTDLVEASVNHTLAVNVENLILTGAGNINGTGNTLANAITGNTGANFIDGKLGNDTLTGGAGNDQFLFSTALGATNIDMITDFSAPNDTIRLDDAIFTGLAPLAYLLASQFAIGAAATTASHRIVYDSATGAVYFDADGNGAGAAKQFATVSIALALTANDFYVF